jgi:negative regulator of sigma-B (phosphoserine phosphatase)
VKLAIAHQSRPAAGEVVCGDAVVVRHDEGATLLVMIDALGHGREAALVARAAVSHCESAPIRGAAELMGSLHEALRGGRGAAASICVLRGGKLEGCGVGNVEVRVLGSAIPTVLTPGIIGHRMHKLRGFSGPLVVGDRLVCFTDGISARVPLGELRKLSPDATCAAILLGHRRPYDDASVLVADAIADDVASAGLESRSCEARAGEAGQDAKRPPGIEPRKERAG